VSCLYQLKNLAFEHEVQCNAAHLVLGMGLK
jgi:hypothetical protein